MAGYLGRSWLLSTAKAVAVALGRHASGTKLRVRSPKRAGVTNTDGWYAVVGDLGKGKPTLEIWFDRFTGYPDRKLFACFRSKERAPLMAITRRVSQKLWPVRVVNLNDTEDERFLFLKQRLARSEFNAPVLEKYAEGHTFYGIYDPTLLREVRVSPYFVNRAIAFFEDVARSLPSAKADDDANDVYPQVENRKHVVSHLQRERSRLLAIERKQMDGYKCQVCGFRFEQKYGRKLGHAFAEAHHVVPLSRLREGVRTRLEDLLTVCSNCHRMLHRMKGERGDISRLRSIIRRKK
jgi:5-methylcytosine-specific restriction endonuclease McrA